VSIQTPHVMYWILIYFLLIVSTDFLLNLQFQGTVNTVQLYGPPQTTGQSQPPGSSQAHGSSQTLGCSQASGSSQPNMPSSRPVTRSRNIVPTVEKAMEVIDAKTNKRKRSDCK
jgi:hypothetical protein